jgi:hypothetical protein
MCACSRIRVTTVSITVRIEQFASPYRRRCEMHTREVNLRRLAHERIEAGELPTVRPGSTRDLQGSGNPCALCGAPILFEEVECDLAGDFRAGSFKFHLACHTVWVTESLSE